MSPDRPLAVETRMTFPVPAVRVWEGITFYEDIDRPPPPLLRLLLPVPIRTEGRLTTVGDEVLCRYIGGHLVKRITRIEAGRLYEFVIAEQALAIGGGLRLRGGRFALHARDGNRTEVAMETCYTSPRWPRWLWTPLERTVCHAFHRHVLGAMRRRILPG